MTATLPSPDLLLAAHPAVATAVAPPAGAPGSLPQQPATSAANPHGSFASSLQAAQDGQSLAPPPPGLHRIPGPLNAGPVSGTPPPTAASATLLAAALRQPLAGNQLPSTGSSAPISDTVQPAATAFESLPTIDSVVAERVDSPEFESDIVVGATVGDDAAPQPEVGTTIIATLAPSTVAAPTTPTAPATAADIERQAAGLRAESTPSVAATPDSNRGISTNLNDSAQSNAQRDYRPDNGETPRPAPDSARPGERMQTGTARTAIFSLDIDAPASTGTLSGETRNLNTSLPDTGSAQQRTLQPMADPQRWSNGLGERLVMMAENGTQTARVKLHPEHLGPLDVRITVEDDTARVWFGAQHAQTREALEAALPRLREMLANQGLELLHADIDAGEQQRQHDDGEFAGQTVRPETSPENGVSDIGADLLSRTAVPSLQLVDIYA